MVDCGECVVHNWFDKVIIDYVRRQVADTFSGVGDDGVEVDLEAEEADC